MNLRGRVAKLEHLRAARRTDPRTLEAVRSDRASVLSRAGVTPDPWQGSHLRTRPERALLLCSRQSGKSTGAAADGLATALTEPGSLVLILSPTLRQSVELFRKAVGLYRALRRPVAAVRVNQTSLELGNGSRIVALPGDPDGIVGYSAPRLVVIDEAARVRDELYLAVRPMLAVGRGRLLCCSTPFGQRGWFHAAWTGAEPWERVLVRATDCPRITPAFLAAERVALGDRWFRQDYGCEFTDASDAVFAYDDILRAVTGDVAPLFPLAV